MTPTGDLIVAGAPPGDAAGLSVMTATLLDALTPTNGVRLVTHEISLLPYARANGTAALPRITLGVQPLTVHGEACVAGRLHRSKLRPYALGWAVGSRYAESLRAAGVTYLIWEATTLRDEIQHADVATVRRSGRGTGLGTMLHKAILPLDERLERRLYRRASAVLAISEYTAGRIRDLHALDHDKVRVLEPPPTSTFLDGLAAARCTSINTPVRDEPSDPLRLLFVGRVDDPRKNFPLLRDALHGLRAAGIPVTLTVIGPYRPEWHRSLDLNGGDAITLLGSVDHAALPSQFLRHHALVVPSRQEGFGIVVSEAMHAGIPVVSTRCGGPEHVLAESGAGIVVDHTAAALASGIRALAENEPLRRAMGELGRAYAERELSPARFRQRVNEELTLLRARQAKQ